MIPEDEKPMKEKVEEDIAALITRIKNTEYDLSHMFKGNALLEQKLAISKKSLEDKQKMLQGLELEDKNKQKTMKEKEEEITEIKEIPITEEQKEEIKAEIEKEFS